MSTQRVSTMMIVLVFAAFVSIGLPDALFGAAWPSIRVEFTIGNAAVGLLNLPAAAVYMASSAMLGTVSQKLNLAQLLTGSTLLVSIGLTLFALAPEFWVIVPAIMLVSAGSGAIDASLNLFAAQKLPTRYMSWLHAFYGLGALAGPFVMAGMFGMGFGWRSGYAIVAGLLWVMLLVFIVTRREWQAEADPESEAPEARLTGRQVLRMPRVQLSMVMSMSGAIIECLAGLWIASILIERFDATRSLGAIGVGVYWVGLTLGRVLVPVVWPSATPIRVQRWSTFVVILATVLLIPNSQLSTWLGVALLGPGIASIFPMAMTITTRRFGMSVSAHAVGYLMSASTFMFAVIPALSGWAADTFSFNVIPILMLAGALMLLATQVVLTRGDTPKQADRLTASQD